MLKWFFILLYLYFNNKSDRDYQINFLGRQMTGKIRVRKVEPF